MLREATGLDARPKQLTINTAKLKVYDMMPSHVD